MEPIGNTYSTGWKEEELTDSIRYASLIQSALLPNREVLEKILPEHFVLFLPKDIVSGDFYWAGKDRSRILVAAGDATGHGVPGAFMSIMGISFLNEIISQRISFQPNRILNQMREKVMKALHQTGTFEETKDGMDISLFVFDHDTGVLDFSGAFNSLYLVRNRELLEYRADRMPIGINAIEEKSFTTHHIRLEKGDCVYLYTDGFPDQFGGPEGKKFKYGPFQKMIVENTHLGMNEQKELFLNILQDWQGDEQQVDDILLIGLRFDELLQDN